MPSDAGAELVCSPLVTAGQPSSRQMESNHLALRPLGYSQLPSTGNYRVSCIGRGRTSISVLNRQVPCHWATMQRSRSQGSNLSLFLTKEASMPLDYNGRARGVGIEPTCAGFKAQLAGQQVSPKGGPVRLRAEAQLTMPICQSAMPIPKSARLPHWVRLGEKESNPRNRDSESRLDTSNHLQTNNRAPPRPRPLSHAARTAVPSLEACAGSPAGFSSWPKGFTHPVVVRPVGIEPTLRWLRASCLATRPRTQSASSRT